MTRPRKHELVVRLTRILRQTSTRPTPTNIHQLRTTVRRVETLCDATPGLPERRREKLKKSLQRLRRRAGRLRDVDVQIAALETVEVDRGARQKSELMQALEGQRGRRERKIARAVERFDPEALEKAFARASNTHSAPPAADPAMLAQALDRFAALAQETPTLTETNAHGFRTGCKRARYRAELAGKSDEAQAALEEFKRIQDAIGGWHDWALLSDTAADVLGDDELNSPLMLTIRSLRRARFVQVERTVAEARRRLLELRAKVKAGERKPVRAQSAERRVRAAG
jgi:CHAD domain-containing protein